MMKLGSLVIAAEVYSPNLGDRLIFEAIRDHLSKYSVSIVPLDISSREGWQPASIPDVPPSAPRAPWVPRNRYTVSAATAMRWYHGERSTFLKKYEPMIKKSDAVIIGGGQLLSDSNLAFPLRLAAVVHLAQRHQRPFAIFNCGIGGRMSFVARSIFRRILSDASFVSVRDDVSREQLRLLSPSAPDAVAHPDVVFGWQPKIAVRPSGRSFFGMNIMAFDVLRRKVSSLRKATDSDFLLFLERMLRGAYSCGYAPILLTNGDPRDHVDAVMAHERLRAAGVPVEIEARPERPATLEEQVGRLQCLFAMRMHAGLLAFTFGKPVVTLCWDQKVADVWSFVDTDVVVDPSIVFDPNPWAKVADMMKMTPKHGQICRQAREATDAALERCLKALQSP